VAVESFAMMSQEDRPLDPFSDGEIDGAGGSGSERDGDDLGALGQHRERAVAPFEAEGFDVGAERSETRRPVIASSEISACSRAEASPDRHQQGADLVAVQAGGVRLVVQSGPADMGRR
jgi:hypothetical protein